jgi:hypothetical protein
MYRTSAQSSDRLSRMLHAWLRECISLLNQRFAVEAL